MGLLNFPEDAHITPIPTDDDLSSLSAILMDDDYYNFTIKHSYVEDGVHIANVESLICLKCKAFLEMTERKSLGEQVDSKHIQKHKKDVFRLAAMLAPSERFDDVPQTLKDDISHFYDTVKEELPNQDFFKSAGLRNITGEQMLKQLTNSFYKMIRLQYVSGLHLEFAENGSYIKHHPLQVTGDILVLAGDIGYLKDENYSCHPFWNWASGNYEQVIVLPGNHEFYKNWILYLTVGHSTYAQMSYATIMRSFL